MFNNAVVEWLQNQSHTAKPSWSLIGISKVFTYASVDVKPDLEKFIVVRFIEEINQIFLVSFVTYNVPISFRVGYNRCIATSEHKPGFSVALGETMVIHRNKCGSFDYFQNFSDKFLVIKSIVNNFCNVDDLVFPKEEVFSKEMNI